MDYIDEKTLCGLVCPNRIINTIDFMPDNTSLFHLVQTYYYELQYCRHVWLSYKIKTLTRSRRKYFWFVLIQFGYINSPRLFVYSYSSEPLFTNGKTSVLPPNLVKSRSREIRCYNHRIALKFDRYLGNDAAESPIRLEMSKFESRGLETSRDLAERRPSA